MAKMLHELLASEKVKSEAAEALLRDTDTKYGKEHFFHGHKKSLKMVNESPENAALEAASTEHKALQTSVYETLEYALGIWAEAEDVIYQKNVTNTKAFADIILPNGTVLAQRVPVDELMGLEVRLSKIRGVLLRMPTVDAAVEWVPEPQMGRYVYRAKHDRITSKNEKRIYPVVLHEGNEHHPAQVKEAARDETVGTFTLVSWTSAATAVQKADAIKRIDDLLASIKEARMRANKTEAEAGTIGAKITSYLLEPLAIK